jgi:hypothetical protein
MPGRRLALILALTTLMLACNLVTESSLPSGSAPQLELYGTFHSMGVVVTLSGDEDPDEDASAVIEYRSAGEPYRPGFPLSRVGAESFGSRFAGSLFWLEPDTAYDVRVTFSDPDGGQLDGVTLTAGGETRPEPSIPQPLQSYYVAPEVIGGACTLNAPCSLAEGLSRAQPGDEVVLRGGIYYQGALSLARSGEPGAPIVVRGYQGEDAILDGADPQEFHWEAQGDGLYQTTINVPNPSLVVAAGERLYPYKNLADLRDLTWDLPGFQASGTKLSVHLANDADPNLIQMAVSRHDSGFDVDDDYIVFSDLTFRHYGRATYARAIFLDNASNNLVQGITFTMNNQGVNIKNDSNRNLIQFNEFHDSLFEWPWDAVKSGGAQFVEAGGVHVNQRSTGRGNVIRHNTFHDMFDGFHLCPDKGGGLTNETDVYENLIFRGECSNVRIWSNTIHDVLNGISLSPVYTGPVYAMRNLIYNTGSGNSDHDGSPFKFIYSLSSDGPVYLFHNTASTTLPDNDGLRLGGERGTWDSIVSRNNIWAGTRYALANYNRGQSLDFDYDALFSTADDRFARWEALPDGASANLADFQTQTGQEVNGLNVDPGFANVASGDYGLASDSPLVDAGVVVPGINDVGDYAYAGSAPDIGAHELFLSR